ncbi:MAG: hypothetical protein AAF662_06795 [Pseudomonadota bacterium]
MNRYETNARTLIWVVLIMLSTACAPNKPYRMHIADEVCERDVKDDRSLCAEQTAYVIKSEDSSAWLTVYEFDDLGYIRDRDLYDRTMARLENIHLTADNGVIMVLFVHGWKHNADPDNENLKEFEKALVRLAEVETLRSGEKAKTVVGAFLGWRGLSATTPLMKQLSFWNRKARAHRIGQNGASILLADLDRINTRYGSNNTFVAIGHSFGGAILYEATQQRLLLDLVNKGDGKPVGRSIADSIILVNSAFEAARIHNLIELAKLQDFTDTQRVILMQFTSEGDTPTKTFFRWGRRLSQFFTDETSSKQEQENVTAVGHHQPFIDYELEPSSGRAADSQIVATVDKLRDQGGSMSMKRVEEDGTCAWRAFNSGDTDAFTTADLTLSRTQGAPGPYMMIKVSKDIITGHNDIWPNGTAMQRNFLDLILEIVSIQDARNFYSC